MTETELAKFIYVHRLTKLNSGEDGLVDPVNLDVRGLLELEEWAMTQAKKLKTQDEYLRVQGEATERLRAAVAKLKSDIMKGAADAGVRQGLEIQAAFAKLARNHKLLN